MRRLVVVILLSFFAVGAFAQAPKRESEVTIDDLIAGAEDWAKENLDDDILELLDEIDRDQVRNFLKELEARFQTNSVYELAPLRKQARALVPILEEYEETDPLAQWLKTRLDYLDVAEELKRAQPVPPKTEKIITVVKAPELSVQRTVWKRQFDRRGLPPNADDYVPRLKEIFEAERMPPELVWIAEVESSFNPEARSPVGATGLFQLMKPTAKTYGLSTFLPDERTHPEKNARAAARYLRHLHDRFGDWPLALAAYNAGETRVDGLLKKSRTRSYQAIADRLPAETQMYVPKCEAAMRKREGVALVDLKRPQG
jgi:membrane-bound lytic murein transglycosylase D